MNPVQIRNLCQQKSSVQIKKYLSDIENTIMPAEVRRAWDEGLKEAVKRERNEGMKESEVRSKIRQAKKDFRNGKISGAEAKRITNEMNKLLPKEVGYVTNEAIAKKYLQLFNSADERGIEFNLSFKHLRRLLERKTCHYTGAKMTFVEGVVGCNARTIDRIDSNKGYTDENTVACTYAANQIKNAVFEKQSEFNMSSKELQKFATKMVSCGF